MWGLTYIHTVKFVMDILRPTIDGGDKIMGILF